MAILQKDIESLRDVLQEVTITADLLMVNGFSALRLAMPWLEGLRVLVRACLDLGLDIHDRELLTFAILDDRRFCQQGPHACTDDCHCQKSVEIILDLNIPISDFDIEVCAEDTRGITYALLKHIRDWREKLKALARHHLPSSERHELGVDSEPVLDCAAPEVIKRLEARGVSPSREFGLQRDDYRLSPPSDPESGSSSIYHEIYDIESAQIAFDLGFKDIDTFYESRTPIMYFHDVCHYRWLFAHGADMRNALPWLHYTRNSYQEVSDDELPRHTVAHHLMGLLTPELSGEIRSTMQNIPDRGDCPPIPSIFDMIRMFCGLEIGDGCKCPCINFEEGCTPIHLFTSWRYAWGNSGKQKEKVVEYIQNILSDTDDDTKARVSYSIVRLLTFEKLELRHTCCTAYGVKYRDYRRNWIIWKTLFEDFHHIREEEASLRDELEDLMSEFKEELGSGTYTLSTFIGPTGRIAWTRLKKKRRPGV